MQIWKYYLGLLSLIFLYTLVYHEKKRLNTYCFSHLISHLRSHTCTQITGENVDNQLWWHHNRPQETITASFLSSFICTLYMSGGTVPCWFAHRLPAERSRVDWNRLGPLCTVSLHVHYMSVWVSFHLKDIHVRSLPLTKRLASELEFLPRHLTVVARCFYIVWIGQMHRTNFPTGLIAA